MSVPVGPGGAGGPRGAVGPPGQRPPPPGRHGGVDAPPPRYPPLPPAAGFFDRYWPGPADPAPGVAVAAVAGVAVTAGLLLSVDRPGLGWLLVGLAATAGTGAVSRSRKTALPVGRLLWGGAALALLAVGTVRAAGWLFLLCLPTAAACGSIALAGGRSARGLLTGAFAAPFAALRGTGWFSRGVRAAQRSSGGSRWLRLLAAVGVGLALLLVFGALFASADPAFDRLVGSATPDLDPGSVIGSVLRFVVFGWAALGAAYLAARPPALDRMVSLRRRPVARIEWLVPVVLLDALFGVFVWVQIGAFFGGESYVLRTAGLTYAQYARGGFWQLSTVTLLTLAVITVAARKAPRSTTADRVALRVALGALAALALIVVASALARMEAYEDAYGLTRLRLLVAVCELWFGLIFLMVLAAGVRLGGPGLPAGAWVPRAVAGTGVLLLLAIAGVNPDRVIADRAVDRFERTGRVDLAYLANLSPDAVPALLRLPAPQRGCALRRLAMDLRVAPDGWSQFNHGRAAARRAMPDGMDSRNCLLPVGD